MNPVAHWLHPCESGNTLRLTRGTGHETPCVRRTLAAPPAPAAAPAPAPPPLPRPHAVGLPPGPDRHPVRAQDRHRLGRPARRAGLRLRQDLPPLLAPVVPGRRLAAPARPATGPAQRRRPDRLAAGDHRRLL